jgi:hypothetical protein
MTRALWIQAMNDRGIRVKRILVAVVAATAVAIAALALGLMVTSVGGGRAHAAMPLIPPDPCASCWTPMRAAPTDGGA